MRRPALQLTSPPPLLSPACSLRSQLSATRSGMLPSSHKAAEAAWERERQELTDQVERFRVVAEGLESAVMRERAEKDAVARKAVQQMDTSLGRVQAEATAEVSRNQEAVSVLRTDLDRAKEAIVERDTQLAELRKVRRAAPCPPTPPTACAYVALSF